MRRCSLFNLCQFPFNFYNMAFPMLMLRPLTKSAIARAIRRNFSAGVVRHAEVKKLGVVGAGQMVGPTMLYVTRFAGGLQGE